MTEKEWIFLQHSIRKKKMLSITLRPRISKASIGDGTKVWNKASIRDGKDFDMQLLSAQLEHYT